jgi:aminobenzoyl-glutamate transport protein
LKKFLPHIAFTLFVAQLLLMLVSWLLSAAFPDSGIRSLLSGEGMRWFFGHFSHQLATPVLVCLVLILMAYGTFRHCGLLHYRSTYRERRALTMTLLLTVVAVMLLVLLAAIPHAVMLSVTGSLWPSPFSRALLPLLSFIVIALSAFYGIMAGHFANLSNVYDALLDGIRQGAALLLFYLLTIQLYLSVCYIISY